MLRLVGNDFKLNAVLFFTLFVLSNIIYLVLIQARMFGGYQFGCVQVGIAIASVMILALFLREEQSKGQVLYRSLPLSHAKIMSARFLSIGIIVVGNILYGFAIQTIYAHMNPSTVVRIGSRVIRVASTQMEAGYAMEHSLLARSLALIFALSIAIPLIVRYGTIWRILFAYLILELVWAKAVDHLLRFSLHTAFFLGLSRWMFFAIGFMCIMLAISHKLSVWLYGRREL